jgi:chromosome segregation ATPase
MNMSHTNQRSTLSAHHAQVIIERMRSQQQQVDRLTDRLRETRDRIANVKMVETELQDALKKIEGRLKRIGDGRDPDLEEEQETLKTRLGFQAQEEARMREVEPQLVAQLQIEQAKLTELNDRLDALQRELEIPPAENKPPQGGKRP